MLSENKQTKQTTPSPFLPCPPKRKTPKKNPTPKLPEAQIVIPQIQTRVECDHGKGHIFAQTAFL